MPTIAYQPSTAPEEAAPPPAVASSSTGHAVASDLRRRYAPVPGRARRRAHAIAHRRIAATGFALMALIFIATVIGNAWGAP